MKHRLPQPKSVATATVEEAIRVRRSLREYSGKPISLGQLSQLLWAAQGITGQGGERSAPSAGAQYLLRVFIVAGWVMDLPVGIYQYDQNDHSIHLIIDRDPRETLSDAVLEDQPWVGNAPLVIALTADFRAAREHFKSQPPKGKRGDRYLYIETGAVAENVLLEAIGIGIGAVLVAGFDDGKVKEALLLPKELEPTALVCIGAEP